MRSTNHRNVVAISLLAILLVFGCKPQNQVATLTNSDEASALDQNPAPKTEQVTTPDFTEELSVDSTGEFVISQSNIGSNLEYYLGKSEVFSSHFTGLSLFDLSTNELLLDYNGEKYFTPASNSKLLTLYAVLRSFNDKLPGALIGESSDTLYIKPIGDPTFLNAKFETHPLLNKIQSSKKEISIVWPTTDLDHFETGWMWDDYNSGYMPELSWFPIFGNVVQFEYSRPNITSTPALFDDLVEIKMDRNRRSNTVIRNPKYNIFEAQLRYPNWGFEKAVPFKSSQSLVGKLLGSSIAKNVHKSSSVPDAIVFDTLYSQPMDTVFRCIMQDSDNFVSEQVLIMSAWKNGFTDLDEFRDFVVANWLPDVEPIWVDGSGLSRYNLMKPNDNIKLLNRIFNEFGWRFIEETFAKGGVSGTIEEWYGGGSLENTIKEPYVFAKTGTLSNNHNLSGYLIAKSGKVLSFSFMNNNFNRPTSEIKTEMQKFLEAIRDAY